MIGSFIPLAFNFFRFFFQILGIIFLFEMELVKIFPDSVDCMYALLIVSVVRSLFRIIIILTFLRIPGTTDLLSLNVKE